MVFFLYINLNSYYIQETHSFSLQFQELLCLAMLYVILRQAVFKDTTLLIFAIAISAIGQAIYGSVQLFSIYPYISSPFSIKGAFLNPGPFSGFLAATFPAILGLYIYRKVLLELVVSTESVHLRTKQGTKTLNLAIRSISILGICLVPFILILSQSRAAWFSVVVGILIFIINVPSSFSRSVVNLKPNIKGILLAAGVVACTSFLFGLYSLREPSANGRLLIWKVTLNIIKENPVFGVGFDRFKANYMNFQASYMMSNLKSPMTDLADDVIYAFNDPLQVIVEHGIFGSIIIILIIILIRKVVRKQNLLR